MLCVARFFNYVFLLLIETLFRIPYQPVNSGRREIPEMVWLDFSLNYRKV
jgi:hypothetical protein